MMAAVLYLSIVVMLEAWPVYRFLNGRMAGSGGADPVPVAIGLIGALLVTVAAVVLPLEAGVRRVAAMEM